MSRAFGEAQFPGPGDVRNIQDGGQHGPHLGGVAVNGLLAAKDQVSATQLVHGPGQRQGRGPGVGPGKGFVLKSTAASAP